MSELRKHYFLDHWTIISEKRGKRPHQFKTNKSNIKNIKADKNCFFCSGNESMTPKELLRFPEKGNWEIRVFNNLYAAIDNKKSPRNINKAKFFESAQAYGYHEVIVDSNDHSKQLHDKSNEHIASLLRVMVSRIKEISKDSNINYVAVFKNHKKEAGASIGHSHCQIIAYNHFPERIKEEIRAFKKYSYCPYCKLLNIESKGPRRAFVNKNFVAFTPYASEYAYELSILPKRHISTISQLNNEEILSLSIMIKKALLKLAILDAPYNLYFHNFPKGKKLHFHVKITPRLNTHAGFELESGTIINTIYPEKAAKFYRK